MLSFSMFVFVNVLRVGMPHNQNPHAYIRFTLPCSLVSLLLVELFGGHCQMPFQQFQMRTLSGRGIPAPIAYAKVVAVKMLVVEFLLRTHGLPYG